MKKTIQFRIVPMLCLLTCSLLAGSQSRLIVNGGTVIIKNGASLVIDNPDSSAISYNGHGYIESEGANNRVIWMIGPGDGLNHVVPFGNAISYFPLRFTPESGIGNKGYFVFSTYPTPTWKNSELLPPGVTNVNRGSIDNSAKLIDRFWQIRPEGYSVKPALANLVITYSDAEYGIPNTIGEESLAAQRWNADLKSWSDYIPSSLVSTATNSVILFSLPGQQLYDWWTLVDGNFVLPLHLVNFNAVAVNDKVITGWQTVYEDNTDHFEIWRSVDGVQFEYLGRVAAAGNSSTILNYNLTDTHPYNGESYYRLKMVDRDGSFRWSAIVKVIRENAGSISIYPNPVSDFLTIKSNSQLVNKKPAVRLYDATGRMIQIFTLTSVIQQFNASVLATGYYHLCISYDDQVETFSFIRK